MSYRCLSFEGTNARKDHRCNYCGEPIHKGDWYMREKSIYEGDFQNVAWHPECNAAHMKTGDFEYTPMQEERPKP